MKSSGGTRWLWVLLLGGLEGFCASEPSDATNAVSAAAAPEMTVSQQGAPGDAAPGDGQDDPAPSGPSQDSPYQAIMGRNAFGLRPVPPPAPPPEVPVNVTPSALKLTGITTLIGKRAMFLVQEPGKKEAVYSDMLREGDKDSSITNLEVLHIDDLAYEVKVVYGGKEMTLNFAQNGIQPPVGAAPTAPGVGPGAVPGRPGGVGGNVPTVAPPPLPGQQPVATVTTAQGMAGSAPTFPPGISGAGSSGLRSIPTRPTRLGGGSLGSSGGVQAVSNVPEVPAFQGTPEQQLQTIVDQSARLEQNGIPMPPVPGGAVNPGGNLDPNLPPAPPALPY